MLSDIKKDKNDYFNLSLIARKEERFNDFISLLNMIIMIKIVFIYLLIVIIMDIMELNKMIKKVLIYLKNALI